MEKERLMIDCFGDICPIPIIKIQDQLKMMRPGEEFMMVTDHSCTIESIKELFQEKSMIKSVEEVMNGVWEVVIVKR